MRKAGKTNDRPWRRAPQVILVLVVAALTSVSAAAQEPRAPTQLERTLGVPPGMYSINDLAIMLDRQSKSGNDRYFPLTERERAGRNLQDNRALQRYRRLDTRRFFNR